MGMRTQMVILIHLRMLPGWYKDPDGDHVQEVRAGCRYKDPDGDPSALFSL